MNIRILEDGIVLSSEDQVSLELRIGLSLGRFSRRIAHVTVSLLKVEDYPGGIGKKCRIEVFLRPKRKVIAEDTDINLDTAIDHAADQISRSVDRKLRREREIAKITARPVRF